VEQRAAQLALADMRLLAADLVAADAAAALAAAVTWVVAAAMAVAAVIGKFIFGSSPKSPSASPATCGGADGAYAP
jgi:VIT1/CCC1 family predicted Fe2+/Mn2+ transporter